MSWPLAERVAIDVYCPTAGTPSLHLSLAFCGLAILPRDASAASRAGTRARPRVDAGPALAGAQRLLTVATAGAFGSLPFGAT